MNYFYTKTHNFVTSVVVIFGWLVLLLLLLLLPAWWMNDFHFPFIVKHTILLLLLMLFWWRWCDMYARRRTKRRQEVYYITFSQWTRNEIKDLSSTFFPSSAIAIVVCILFTFKLMLMMIRSLYHFAMCTWLTK